jgi:predicted double-glycine peptidase
LTNAAVATPLIALRLAIALVMAMVVVAGCAPTTQTAQLDRRPPPDLAAVAELTEVPFFPQKRYQCGPAAMATVLSHAGFATKPDTLVDEVYVPEKRGALRTEMRAAARARGAVPYALEPELEQVLQTVDAGHPVLVMQNLGIDWWPRWHYAVVVGYDLGKRHVVLRTGETRRRVTLMSTFERTWMRADRWAQVVVAPSEPPAIAQPLPWLRTVRELEETGQQEAAVAGYRSATERWPDERRAWMALGNAYLATQEAAAARTAFERAIELNPQAGEAWNNLAYALARSGCGDTALTAARCATRLAPDRSNFDATLDELSGKARAQALGADCGIPTCPAEGQGGG